MRKSFVLLLLLSTTAFADEATVLKSQAMNRIESMFDAQQNIMTVIPNTVKTPLPNDIDISISNKWVFTIKSKQAITINRIGITLDGVTVVNPVGVEIKPNVVKNYLFNSGNLPQAIASLTNGYNVFGAYRQISAEQFKGYSDYRYKIATVSINWTDANKNFMQSDINMMLVMAK